MSDSSGTTIFDYDSLGRLTTINYGNGIRQQYAYDRSDRVANLTVSQGSMKHINLGYDYDKVGRLVRVNDEGKHFEYKYNAIGQLMEELNGVTGIKSSYQYYPSGNIKNLRHWDGKNIVSNYEYKYDKRGNQVQKDEGTGTTKYYYDALSRVKTVVAPDKTQNYEYDDLDNIRELAEIKGTVVEETSYMYDRDSRLLLQETNKGTENIQRRFTYDDNGNQLTKDEVVKRNGSLVSSKTSNYWYDGYNQLMRVQNPDGQFIDYTYNGNGLRTKKDFGDKATNYYYNSGNIILETDKNNMATARNIRGLRLIYRENNPGQVDSQFLYYLHNAHGDVTQLLNEKGQLIKDYRYDTFGQEEMPESQVFGGKQTGELWRQEVEKIDNPFRYCGEYLDEETGNYYLRARYYDPSIQRFVNGDSYGVKFGAGWKQHLYNYVGNNPINRIDPTGHFFIPIPSVSSIISSAVGFATNLASNTVLSVGTSIGYSNSSGGSGNKTVTIASKNTKDSVITAGPDAIQKAGMAVARNLIDKNCMNVYVRHWILGSSKIGDYSYGKYYLDNYQEAVYIESLIKEWAKTGDTIKSIYDYTEQTGSLAKGILFGLISSKLGNDQPSLSDIDFVSKMVEKARKQYEFVDNSSYKFLIYDSSLRKEFIKQLTNLEKDVTDNPLNPYKNKNDNQKYQQAILDYIRGTRTMNENFKQSKENLLYQVSLIE